MALRRILNTRHYKIITPIDTPWIYHNSDLWLISLSSNGSNWITIADKNLWATTVYNSWDTLSEANCGKYYQWGNNYGFPRTWSVTTSTAQVNAQNYWPWNYYSDSTFRSNWWTSRSWDSSWNQNLWWWTTDTNSAKQWPCNSWYHIPSKIEYVNLLSLLTNIWIDTTSRWSTFNTYLLMPLSWNRDWNSGTVSNQWTTWFYWSASWSTAAASSRLVFWTNATPNTWTNEATYWEMIRPFKNEAVTPDWTWTVLYQAN